MTSSPLPIPPEEHDVPGTEQVPIPDWHREILDELMAKYAAHGFEGMTWEEFKKELADS